MPTNPALIHLATLLAALASTSPGPAQGTLAMYCSSPNTAWCQGMAVGSAVGSRLASHGVIPIAAGDAGA